MSLWKTTFLIFCLLAAGFLGWAGERVWVGATGRSGSAEVAVPHEEVVPARPEGGLKFRETKVRIKTKEGTTIRYEFPFTNASPSSITITKVRTSCGRCSSGKPARNICEPGEHGTIVLMVDTQGQSAGPKGYTATVEYRNPEPHEARLVLVVDYAPEILIVPETMTLTLTAGRTATGRFRIIDERPEASHSRRFTTSMKGVRVTAVPHGPDGRVQEFEVCVEDDRALPLGQTQALIHVQPEGDDSQIRALPLTVEKVARVRAAPSLLYLKRTSSGGAEGKILISDFEGEQVAIENVEVSGKAALATFDRDARLRPLITVQMRNAADLRFPIPIRIRVVRPCRQEVVVSLAGLAS